MFSSELLNAVRNVYILINFGDFVDGSNSSVADPFIQLLPTTNLTLAHADFVTARLGGVDTTASQPPLLPPGQGKISPDPSTGGNSTIAAAVSLDKSVEHGSSSAKKGLKIALWVIMLIIIAGAALLSFVCFCALRSYRSRRSKVKSEPVFVPPMSAYHPLLDQNAQARGEVHTSQTPYAEPNYLDDVKYA